ncbi:Cell wall-binding protein yocH precursor [uncultured Eubacterium sp.]|uniref:G5 domain-containing protein n=1 Tax=Brotomerdimonas butyrica TaxID=2981721 RepID=UPI000822B923|nr:G5 domain-containing protein [Brotomerdimonas butyrica]MCU6755040.1 G5 domain-containing protein [Brotomerdimonas butyrica]SCH08510.1 Cell wall-binding protein yocH precursor [uncultured Eubacterium sp.]
MKIKIKDVFEKDEKDIHVQTNERLDIDEIFEDAREERQEMSLKEEKNDAAGISDMSVQDSSEEPAVNAGVVEASDDAEQVEPSRDAAEAGPEEVTAAETPDQQEKPGDETCEPAGEQAEAAAAATAETAESPEVAESAELSADTSAEETPLPEAPADPDVLIEPEAPEAAAFTEEPSYKKYISLGAIAAAFVILAAVMLIYNNLVPREVTAVINGEKFEFESKAHTVEGFLEENDIEFSEGDYVSQPLTAYISDGMKIKIDHATDFKITADGKTRKYRTLANTVSEALKDKNVKVGKNDIVEPGLDELLTKNMKIVIKRVKIKEETKEEKIEFKTVTKDDSSLDEGTTKVVTEGVEGKAKVTYKVTYVDGVESSRSEISRETLTAAVDKVVANGTRINFDGQSYSRKLVVKAYAYTGGGTTAMGTRARVGEIAVDPSVIPLGSEVYIEGVGARRAEDTGGNIVGNTIDIYMDTNTECISWGARYVTIYIK